MTNPLKDSAGPVALSQQLGKGGEGSVFDVSNRQNAVAKLYHKPADTRKAAKLRAMVAMKSERLLALTAWPTDILIDNKGAVVGFLMSRVSGHKDIHELYSPHSRKSAFPTADWRFLVRAAANTARAFAAIHDAKAVIGDVNHGGIAVSSQATVKVIDCDSFQVSSAGEVFTCDVGVPTFTPPELQNRPFRGLMRSANHDNFGLAVMIFHLLFMGRHPFAGRYSGTGDMGIEKAIAEFRYAYGHANAAAKMSPPPNMPPVAALSKPVADLFEQAFGRSGVQSGRPTASQWATTLHGLEQNIITCTQHPGHHYLKGVDRCPWCQMEQTSGATLFHINFQAAPLRHGGSINVAAIWVQIQAIQRPRAEPFPGANPGSIPVEPTAEAKRGSGAKVVRKFLAICAAIGALFLMLNFPKALIIWLIGGIWAAIAIWNGGKHPNLSKFKEEERQARNQYEQAKALWEKDAGTASFDSKLSELERMRREYENLPNYRKHRYQLLESKKQEIQLRNFLDGFEIEKAQISNIGPTRKAMLASYNIETAADIPLTHVLPVPGFGPALTENLTSWRKSIERKFRYDPSKPTDPQAIAKLEQELAKKKTDLERELSQGPTVLAAIRAQIIARRTSLRAMALNSAKSFRQAEVNLKVANGESFR